LQGSLRRTCQWKNFAKAIALNRMDIFDLKKLNNEDNWISSFEDEIAFLLEDMPEV